MAENMDKIALVANSRIPWRELACCITDLSMSDAIKHTT